VSKIAYDVAFGQLMAIFRNRVTKSLNLRQNREHSIWYGLYYVFLYVFGVNESISAVIECVLFHLTLLRMIFANWLSYHWWNAYLCSVKPGQESCAIAKMTVQWVP